MEVIIINTNEFEEQKPIIIDKRDFPFEDVPLSRWLIAMAILFVGFIIPNIVEIDNKFFAIGLLFITFILPLFIIDLKFFKKLFKGIKFKDIGIILFTLFLVFLTAFVTANLAKDSNLVNNPIEEFISFDNVGVIFLITLVSLMAEEILFVIPFLFVYNNIGGNRIFKIIMALLISSIIFGLAHLWTYNFNLIQCLFIIGMLRIPMSLPYIWRKNLLLTYIVHLAYDWIILFSILYFLSSGEFIK